MRDRYQRQTKIIATLGPATESDEQLARLISAGVDVLRLNMAHGTREWVLDLVARIRKVSGELSRQVAVMMDIKGPEIRTGPVDEPIRLQVGDSFELYTKDPTPGSVGVSVNYPGLPNDVEVGSTMLVDSGLMRFQITDKDATRVQCKALTAGAIGSRRHINLPGADVSLPALTEKDERDVRTGVEAGVDFFALSFVRKGEDVVILQRMLDRLDCKARVIAKIEDQSGLRFLEDVVRAADAIMVARGDLGIEIEYHRLALVQTQMVDLCLKLGKPVIIATQLLESMISAPMPTRAEISDISTAVRERADAVMLSGETTTGQYPLECVEVMKNILRSVEPTLPRGLNEALDLRTPKAKMLRSAARLAQDLGNCGVVIFLRNRTLAYQMAALRAVGVPIYAFTDDESLFRQLLLPWGVEPFLMPLRDDPELTIQDALAYLLRRNWVSKRDWVVVLTNAMAHDRVFDSMQLRSVE